MTNHNVTKTLATIRRLLANDQMADAVRLIEALLPPDQADIFLELPIEEQISLLKAIDRKDAVDVLENLDDEDAASLASALGMDDLVKILDLMAPDEVADLLGDFDPLLRKEVLSVISRADKIRELLKYPDDTAGGLMTTQYYVFSTEAVLGDIFEQVRSSAPSGNRVPYIYAVDDAGKLFGVTDLVVLVRAHPDQPLKAVVDTDVITINPQVDQVEAITLMNRYDLLALPVIDEQGRMLGVISIDDVMTAQRYEGSEMSYRKAGIVSLAGQEAARSDLLVRGPIWRTWLVRIPFLIVTLLGGMLAGSIIGVYEETLEAIIVLAFFIPVIMDMGGNMGSQADEIFIRAFALEQITPETFMKYLAKEGLVCLGMGIILGMLGGLIAGLWVGIWQVGLVVGLALGLTLLIAALLGYLIPYANIKIGWDPAAASSAFITTIKDITGIFIYFFLATQFLGFML